MERNVRIMLLRWVHLAWCRNITFPHVGRVSHLIPFHALLLATTLEMSRKSYVTFEQNVFRPPRPGVSALFHALLDYVLYHVPLGCSSFVRLAQSLEVYMIKGCVDASSVSAASSPVDLVEHNVGNPIIATISRADRRHLRTPSGRN